MSDPTTQAYVGEIADIERELAIGTFHDLENDIGLLVQAVLSHAALALDVPRLDLKAQTAESIDLPELRSAAANLDIQAVRDARIEFSDGQDPLLGADDLAPTKEALKAVEDAASNQHHFETGLRVELGLALPFFRVQLDVADRPEALVELERQVGRKVGQFSEEVVRRLWGMLTSEFQPREARIGAPAMPDDREVLGADFFNPATIDEIRHRVVAYAVRLKPLLVRKMFLAGGSSFRSAFPSVPQLLAARDVIPLSLQEDGVS